MNRALGQNTEDSAAPGRPRPAIRALASAAIAFHVFAVFVGPWALPQQASQLSAETAQLLQPYLQVLSLDNGYRFFAPEPGPSHLVRYEVTRPDGEKIDGSFPDLEHHWPRLLYHRYFMLSEFINSIDNRGTPKEVLAAYIGGYADHLESLYPGSEIKLYLRRHFVPRVEEVRAGRRLADPLLYIERQLYPVAEEVP